jgi:hypothetical protein
MEEHPRIRQARERLNPPPTERVGTLGKDVPSWCEWEEPNPNEVEGGRRMSQRLQAKEGKSTIIIKYNYIEFKTPAKTKTFSAEEALQEMNEDAQEEIRARKAQLAQEQ